MAENILDIMVALYTFKAQNDTELSFDKARLFSFGFLTLGLSVLPNVLIIIMSLDFASQTREFAINFCIK